MILVSPRTTDHMQSSEFAASALFGGDICTGHMIFVLYKSLLHVHG